MAEGVEGRETDGPFMFPTAFLSVGMYAVPGPLVDGDVPESVVRPELDTLFYVTEVVQHCVTLLGMTQHDVLRDRQVGRAYERAEYDGMPHAEGDELLRQGDDGGRHRKGLRATGQIVAAELQ